MSNILPLNEIENAKDHELWPYFEEYAYNDGTSLEHHDDWLPSWRCFLAGINAVQEHESKRIKKAALGEDS